MPGCHALPRTVRPAPAAGTARHLRHALTLLLLILAAACGELPRPFLPEDKTGNPLLAPIEGAALEVLPLQGHAPNLPLGGAAYVAEGLAANGVAATIGGRTAQSRLLLGVVAVTPASSLSDYVIISWEVYGPGGSLLGRYAQQTEVPKNRWLAGDPDTLRLVGLDAGPILGPIAAGPEQVPETGATVAAGADGGRVRIALAGVSGAPGDGGRSLPRALSSVLTQRGFLVVEQPLSGDLVVEGVIALAPAGQDREQITLAWRLLDGPQGARLGEVQQGNVIPAGSLDGTWGDVAALIAVGAADGIVDLLTQAGKL
jgi:hypothetical protein